MPEHKTTEHAGLTNEDPARLTQTHPICEFAPDKDACGKYVERLSEASNNIDRRATH